MKKTLAVVLTVVMIFSCFALCFCAFAEETSEAAVCSCECRNCIKNDPTKDLTKDKCHCCINCEYLDKRYLTHCVVVDENGNIDFGQGFCCENCTGIWPCHCGHDCCDPDEEIKDDYNGGPVLTPSQQNSIIRAVKNLIQRFSDAFDKIFDAIFEFLRISEVFPDIKI